MKKQTFAASVLLFALVGGVAVDASTPDPSVPHGTFQPVGNTTTPRANPTATLLNDGTVLVTGGWKRSGADYSGNDLLSQATAELFDPKTNTFSPTGPMAYPRASHAAVRLQDGRVLVVGGSNDKQAQVSYPGEQIAAAELYDPATGKFSTTGDMITPRNTATATLLTTNGKVLITGGLHVTKPYVLQTAEMYDPATGKFASTGPMTVPRNNHAAVGLPDGRVVVLGGLPGFTEGDAIANGQPLRSVEIYDPNTGKFSPAGEMVEGRAWLQATLLPDGRILVSGGVNSLAPDLNTPDKISNSVEIYDPATGRSTVTDHMADTRWNHTAVALADGRVLVVGGNRSGDPNDPNLHLLAAALVDPITGKVSPTGSMISANGVAPTLLPDGRVLVLGGRPRKLMAEVYVP